jgi:serine/threonine-protein kinase RsbW
MVNGLTTEPRPRPEVDGVEIKMVLYLPRDTASVPVSRQVLDGCLETLGVTPDTRADIALALTEACANVVLHAGPGDAYEVEARTRNGQCVIEVINTASEQNESGADGRGTGTARDGRRAADGRTGQVALTDEPVPVTAEHGRGLKIIDAVVDNLQLTGNEREGTTVHFEKTLDWLPGAAGEHLFSADGGRQAQHGQANGTNQ